jgi:hypothetical protein
MFVHAGFVELRSMILAYHNKKVALREKASAPLSDTAIRKEKKRKESSSSSSSTPPKPPKKQKKTWWPHLVQCLQELLFLSL